jgi:O-antigen ligase
MRSLFTLALAYLLSLGLTFNGLLALVDMQPATLALLGLGAAAWLILHQRLGWCWHVTPYDLAFAAWGLAIGASVFFNLADSTSWRRSAEALGYVGLYLGCFYLLADSLANGVRRRVLADSLLLIGLAWAFFALWQVANAWGRGEGLVRPVSLLGNANALGAAMSAVGLLALGRAWAARRAERLVMGLYAVLCVLVVVLSDSRGALLGLACGVSLLLALSLWRTGWFSRARWREATAPERRRVQMALGLALATAGLLGLILLDSLNQAGRTADYRLLLWGAALEQFRESPLVGQGLFTYGHRLALSYPTPPNQPHSHPHNFPLLVAAELGLLGLVVLAWTAFIAARTWWHSLADGEERATLWGAGAALLAYGVHHLFDTPSMMPAIALIGLLLFSMACLPLNAQPMQAVWRKLSHPLGMVLLWAVVIGAGAWNSGLYRQVYAILSRAYDAPLASAQALQPLIDADPYQPAYRLQQALLYGLVAWETGDSLALAQARAGYLRYTELEPYQASAWVNRAALACQAGDLDDARRALAQAQRLADWPPLLRLEQVIAGQNPAPLAIVQDERWLSFARWQFLRDVLPQEYLPQVGGLTTCAP